MIVAGFGFRAGASVESLLDAFEHASQEHTVNRVATLTDKAQTEAFKYCAQSLGLPFSSVEESDLKAVHTVTESPPSREARGTGSVAEATALLAAGPGAEIIQARVVSKDRLATCALARSRSEGGAS